MYCPRLFYLEWVQGEFAHSHDTLEGKKTHHRVDKESGELADAGSLEPEEKIHARSVSFSSDKLGLTAKIDLVEGEGQELVPVDYKKGVVPSNEQRSYEPERVQLCAQAMLLRENGYQCKEGVVYYAGSKARVSIPINDELVARTLELVGQARAAANEGRIPSPLVDSPKCPRCSLVGICLPDEVIALSPGKLNSLNPDEVRRLFPARDDALPLYIQEQGVVVAKDGDELEIRGGKAVLARAKLFETSSVALFGNIQITTQTVHELCTRDIPVCYFSYGGWFYGITQSMGHKNVQLRQHQYTAASHEEASLPLARRFISGKIRNCRTLLRRNCKTVPEAALDELARLADAALITGSRDELFGIEGAAGRVYFSHFAEMIKGDEEGLGFDFHSRNRRPPKDPINALLSFTYTLLTSTTTVVLMTVGFDPYLGFFHQPRYGRPSLALDLMEEFRPIIADSTVIGLVNNNEVSVDDMIRRAGSVAMTPGARKKVIRAYERRLETLITHPVFGYSISYRRVLEVQARLMGRYLIGEIGEYPMFLTR